jgi:DNA mismatch repair ATPase MutS
MGNQDVDTDTTFVTNSVSLTSEYPIEIIEGFNSSGKTQYIRNVLKCLNQGLNIGHVNAESMRIGNLSEYAYMDRVVSS